MINFRDLRADEIDVRVAMVRDNGLQLLLYKDARVDMNILDETVGAEHWSRDHFEACGALFCRVGVYCTRTGEWNYKADCGSESNTEPEKGKSSDAFKRACTNWGIGRELYTAPFIWIPNANGNYTTPKERFRVESITIEDKRITALKIVNSSGRVVYTLEPKKPPRRKIAAKESEPPKHEPFYSCLVCGKETEPKIAIASIKKYGKVYCSKDCFERRPISND